MPSMTATLAQWHRTAEGIKGLRLLPYADVNGDLTFNVIDLKYYRASNNWSVTIRSELGDSHVYKIEDNSAAISADPYEIRCISRSGAQLRLINVTAAQRVQTEIIDAWSQVDKLLHKGVS